MRTFRVLIRRDGSAASSLHLVQTDDETAARAIAEVLMRETPGAAGVAVWEGERRLYARGEPPD